MIKIRTKEYIEHFLFPGKLKLHRRANRYSRIKEKLMRVLEVFIPHVGLLSDHPVLSSPQVIIATPLIVYPRLQEKLATIKSPDMFTSPLSGLRKGLQAVKILFFMCHHFFEVVWKKTFHVYFDLFHTTFLI